MLTTTRDGMMAVASGLSAVTSITLARNPL